MTRSNEDISLFINRIMGINAKLAGMGGAEAAIFGTTHPAASTVTQLKNTTIGFAEAYRKDSEGDATRRLAQEVEALLFVLVSMSVISDTAYAELTDLLKELVPFSTEA